MPSLWHSLPALLLLPTSIYAVTHDCSHIRADGQSFDLQKLGGRKEVHYQEWARPTISNTTITLNICKPLEKEKDVEKDETCSGGTWICAKEWLYRKKQDPFLEKVIAIAGYPVGSSKTMDAKYTRLKNSAGNSDDKEGVIVELHGPKYPDNKSGKPQKAVIEFLCEKGTSGNEGFGDNKLVTEASEYGSMQRRADDDDDTPELPDLDKGKNLQVLSFKDEDEEKVLRMRWKTKFACEGAINDSDGDKKAGWGFFTWFIIILFLLVASYIIFGSWLNYNRYGARGWDLIPHGDTIRDIPYVAKDWVGNMADRLKGGDSRGGYSAV